MLARNISATLTIVITCCETGDPLPGARYSIMNRARQRAVKTSCEKGLIRFAGLPSGIYRLEECRPPAGYRPNPVVHKIIVYNGRIAADGKFTRELRYTSMPLHAPFGQDESQVPAINAIYTDDALITGAGRAGRRITVTFPDGRQLVTRVQQNNAWRVGVPPDIRFSPGEIILAGQASGDAPGNACGRFSLNQTAAAVIMEGPAATVTGTVSPVAFGPGEAGAAVVCLCTLEGYEVLRTQAEPVSLSGEGKYLFEAVPAGQYVVHIQRPGFLPSAQLIQVKSGAARTRHECAAIRLVGVKR